ncbi:MAG TPA: AraC family transcriptional regulator [Victivallales bacterium]|nr:AraC family transcriptional regulator [Victivallales bacterium]HPO89693.1 AraC family transcriptional regulator [Victivallales bacterium]HRR29110.1 AraC family transcriptional regulator [Victivallales bacterium]HRU01814.1 AraC family transcriptional regulator [Victivallales bacterium]
MTVNIDKTFYRKPSPATSLPFKVRVCGKIEDSPHHATLGTYNKDAMVMVFISGKGYYVIGKNKFEISGGMLGLILPNEEIGILSSDPKFPYEHYYCRFAGHEAMKIAERIRIQMKANFIEFNGWSQLTEYFERLIGLSRKFKSSENEAVIERMTPTDSALAMLLSVIEFSGEENGTISSEDLLRYMMERISSPVDLNMMATHFNLSKEHLCRKAKKLLGDTLYNCWYKEKMNWAMKLLRETDDNIYSIALKCGYKDPLYFSKVFKSFTNKSPKEWRKKFTLSKNIYIE